MEEAAQVLESHIVASLTTSCQQLIMIGDHKQLRPACNVHQLATQYKMDRSLFERMIELGLPAVTLEVQYRKHPDIASLIVPSVYPRLSLLWAVGTTGSSTKLVVTVSTIRSKLISSSLLSPPW